MRSSSFFKITSKSSAGYPEEKITKLSSSEVNLPLNGTFGLFKKSSMFYSYTRILTAFTIIAVLVIACKKKDSAPPPTAPLVTTAALTNVNISAGSATAGGSIVSDGGATITQSGIVWSKTNNTPTLTDSLVAGTIATGTFTSNITGLDFNNTYYFRAFATNSVGTGYGDVVTLTTSADSVKFTYNGQSVTYGIITSPTTGKKWLDRNLGAKRQATAFDDYQAYGDLFQWGRPADGHQLINWTASTAGTGVNGMTATLATSDNPGHNNFIDGTSSPKFDWRSDNNNNRWFTTPQGPCPTGWHVPKQNEWAAEVSNTQTGGTATSGGMTNYNLAFSLLKLTVSGRRDGDGSTAGQISRAGLRGYYWSSSTLTTNGSGGQLFDGWTLNFASSYTQMIDAGMDYGFSIRCIKD